MNNNQSTISHSIRDEEFKYDVLKGELSKGSSISKAVHPLCEVEEFKQKLLKHKNLKDVGAYWILKKNIRTGLLMAINLHTGQYVKESPYKQDIIVTSEEAAELKDKLPEKNVCVTDSEIVMKSICDTLRFSSTSIVEVNADTMIHHGSDSFGCEEAFALKVVKQRGIVSRSARHGYSDKKEADIVDEIHGEQYEVVYEFKTSLSKKKMKPDLLYSPEMLALQLVDSPFIHVSKALERKLKKEYTDRYRSNLVILTLGTRQSTIAMLEALSDKLKKDQMNIVNYANIYIISLDFINEQGLFARISSTAPFASESFLCKNDELGFIKLTPVEFWSMKDDKKYLMICDGIFDKTRRFRYDEGKALKGWAKEVHIWGIPPSRSYNPADEDAIDNCCQVE
jgi:hypothetical protein